MGGDISLPPSALRKPTEEVLILRNAIEFSGGVHGQNELGYPVRIAADGAWRRRRDL
ncbi:hypothetical protein [Bradyrhizobium sp. F1.13.3]|uniref:hypothetical protein n=1 Tax=Bradyrhizobium sp. F1.13.3 TaxID=3156351 RepID=UPI00339843F0